MGKLDPGVLAAVIEGVARACRENGAALLGGETAEMPGLYQAGEYDVAGTIVGAVDREKILDGTRVRPGDVAIGLPSAGLHTNGYSLARRILFEDLGKRPGDRLKELGGRSVAEVLLAPHRSYLRALEPLLKEDLVHAMAHITGGGFFDNIPRVLPADLDVRIRSGSWPVLPVFDLLEREGKVSREEMHRVFNMGIGMVLLVPPESVTRASDLLSSCGEPYYFIGNVIGGRRQVLIDFA
jgi:phosphoribosylformylglycinamidine cyclo-ligase